MSFINEMVLADGLLLIGKEGNYHTGIYDDFDGGVYNSFWQSDYKNDWEIEQWPSGSGNYVSVRNNDGDDDLTDPTVAIGGDFSLEVGLMYGPSHGANDSVRLEIEENTGQPSISETYIRLTDGNLRFRHNGYTYNYSWPWQANTEIKARMRRINGTVYFEYDINDGNGWQLLATTPWGDSNTEFYLWINGANQNGVSYFNFEAEYGLPTYLTSGSFYSHRLDRQVNSVSDLIKMWTGPESLIP